jgi:putative ABC transport system permease protein
MRVARNLRLSVAGLTSHPVRSALAVLGSAVGVAGVLVMTAVGEGARAAVVDRIQTLGPTLLVVMTAPEDPVRGGVRRGRPATERLRPSDADAIVAGSRAVRAAAPSYDGMMSAKRRRISAPATVVGTSADWLQVRGASLSAGRFLTDADGRSRARVAVLGGAVSATLFPDGDDPLGETVRLGPTSFQVVGVLPSRGTSVTGATTEDDQIFIPLETALRRVFNVDYVKLIYVEAMATSAMDDAERDVAALLRARQTPVGPSRTAPASPAFLIQNQRLLLDTELAAQASFQRLIMGLGFLSLIVGGVGILSIMLLSVRERRNEIGLRVALGARSSDLLGQFLAEALLLASAGGAAGTLLGVGAARLVSTATAWDARLTGAALVAATGSALVTGLVFGVLPAWRAAKLDPVEALRT